MTICVNLKQDAAYFRTASGRRIAIAVYGVEVAANAVIFSRDRRMLIQRPRRALDAFRTYASYKAHLASVHGGKGADPALWDSWERLKAVLDSPTDTDSGDITGISEIYEATVRLYRRGQRTARLSKTPGALLHRLGRILFFRAFYSVIQPAISDMQSDYFAALAKGDKREARMARVVGTFYVIATIINQIPHSIRRAFLVTVWWFIK